MNAHPGGTCGARNSAGCDKPRAASRSLFQTKVEPLLRPTDFALRRRACTRGGFPLGWCFHCFRWSVDSDRATVAEDDSPGSLVVHRVPVSGSLTRPMPIYTLRRVKLSLTVASPTTKQLLDFLEGRTVGPGPRPPNVNVNDAALAHSCSTDLKPSGVSAAVMNSGEHPRP